MLTSNCSFLGDLQEPFRWIADVAVMEAFESGVLDLPNFYFTGDDYRYRFELEAKQRFLDLLRERFNSGVRYKERALKWDTVIEQKTAELGRYLAGRNSGLDFSEPSPWRTNVRSASRENHGIMELDKKKRSIGCSVTPRVAAP
jgi:CRISPR-associated protein Cas1